MTAGSSTSGLSIVRQCEKYLKSFNPVTHSIDSHLVEQLNTDVAKSGAKDIDVLKAQLVTGVLREKKVLDGFIRNFYGDNAACVLRSDMTMYTIYAYIAIFRLRELGFARFKELASTEDPSKISTFVTYLFNKDVLMNQLRSDWSKVSDLTFVEDNLICNCERFIPDAQKYTLELAGTSAGLAAAEASKEATSALKLTSKPLTRPVSPNLSRPRPPRLPEPERISQKVDGLGQLNLDRLNRTTIAKLEAKAKQDAADIHAQTYQKYTGPAAEALLFKFNETKGGRKLEDVRKEIEARTAAELQFDNTYIHSVPDFNKKSAKIRLNAASILKEDFLYRKQQAKDAAILKNYEEELRDPIEYFTWQSEMRQRDHIVKLEGVAQRRDAAKQGSIEAHLATQAQLSDNKTVALLMRQQAEIIAQKKALEAEIETIEKRQAAIAIAAVRDTAPASAVEKVVVARVSKAAQTRAELEALREAKEKQDHLEEEIRADNIRRLRAVNTVHRAKVSIFDPTQTAGIGLLDEMSYMEMKERLASERARAEVKELNRRGDIIEAKLKKAHDLEARANSVLRARQVKAEANKAYYANKREEEKKNQDQVERAREIAAVRLEGDLRDMREAKKREAQALAAEQERIAREQAYLGAASGAVEENREKELLMAKERQIATQQRRASYDARKALEAQKIDRENKHILKKSLDSERQARDREREDTVKEESRDAVRKIKAEVLRKKMLAASSRHQHTVTAKVKEDFNPYAAAITAEGLAKSKAYAKKLETRQLLTSSR